MERTAPRDVIAYKPKGLFRRIGSKGDLFGYRELLLAHLPRILARCKQTHIGIVWILIRRRL